MANNTGIKYGGRVAGTPNRTNKETREALKKIIDDELDNLPELLQLMKPNQRIDVLVKLIHYVLPKPENTIDLNNKLNEVHILPEWLTSPIN